MRPLKAHRPITKSDVLAEKREIAESLPLMVTAEMRLTFSARGYRMAQINISRGACLAG